MSLLHSLHRNVKTIAMPMGMVVGALLCRPVTAAESMSNGMITPTLIFLMLFFTFCRVKPRQMRVKMLHVWLLAFQIVGSIVVYLSFVWFDPLLAQGAMICVLAPVAMAAVVIVALVAPMLLSFVGSDHATFLAILSRVGPVLVLPFVCAQLCRKFLPGVAFWVSKHSQISFYMWLVSLVFVIGRTTAFIIDLENAEPWTEIALGLVAMVICVVQFGVGRMLGRRYGDAAAGGQSLGQKNTVLAVWMAQSFLNPISSIAPTAYIVWQNFVNSYQIYKKDRKVMKNQI